MGYTGKERGKSCRLQGITQKVEKLNSTISGIIRIEKGESRNLPQVSLQFNFALRDP